MKTNRYTEAQIRSSVRIVRFVVRPFLGVDSSRR